MSPSRQCTGWGCSTVLLNLHTHLEGSVRAHTAYELAVRAGVPAPAQGWEEALSMRAAADLTVFLRHVAAVYPVLGSAEALYRVGYEAVQDAAADGQVFVEIRVGPGTHSRPGLSVADVLAAVSSGVQEAATDTGTMAGVVACLLRHETDDLISQTARAAANMAGHGVVALDLAGDELLYPDLARYAPAFALAQAAGLGTTAHAAEAAPGSAARDAVEELRVRRIGHGSGVADRADLLAWARAERVCLEVCATSNLLTGAADSLAAHPVHAMIKAGVAVVLGDDDPVTTGSRLSHEGALLLSAGLSVESLADCHRTAVEVAFCSDSERRALRRQLAAASC